MNTKLITRNKWSNHSATAGLEFLNNFTVLLVNENEGSQTDESKIVVNYGNWEKGQFFFTKGTYWKHDIDIEW